MRSARRLRHRLVLLWQLCNATAYAGGWRRFAATALKLWRQDGYAAVALWALGAIAHSQRTNAVRYRAWLAQRPAPAPANGAIVVVMSTQGVAAAHLPGYLRLALARKQAAATLVVVTDAAGAAATAGLHLAGAVLVAVPALSVDAVLSVARSRRAAADFLVLVGPGCIAAETPCSVTEEAVLFYGDEDRIDAKGHRQRPFFKPGFCPDLLFVHDYLSSCLILSRALAAALPEDACGDYHSLALRLAAQAQRVVHLDAIAAHRFVPNEAAVAPPGSRPPAYLAEHLQRCYGDGARVVTQGGRWHCEFGNGNATVAVVVPTRDRLPLLRRCVEGLFASNTGSFEVLILDNGSTDASTLAWFAEAKRRWPQLNVLPASGEFNWSRLNNQGIAASQADVLVFLNNDTEPLCEGWLSRLADVALRPDVGAVGALLLYETGSVQHAGMVVGYERCVDHVYRHARPDDDDHMFVSPLLPRNVAAVTGACMAVSRRTIDAIGGFDERYRVAGGDVEMCIRAMNAGYLNVYLPEVRLRHYEMQTRLRTDPPEDNARLIDYLAEHCPRDPFYNSSLSLQVLYPSYPTWG